MIGTTLTGKNGTKVKIVREIGSGGFGVVYLGEAAKKKQYAVKVIAPLSDPQTRLSFEKELNATHGLSHENLLLPLDHGECKVGTKDGVFVISEYCPDGNYRHRVSTYKRESSDIEVILRDFEQILHGLDALHAKLIHRDLKPDNILMSNGKLMIGDFGLTKLIDDATQTLTFKGSGTPLYMAPEVWELQKIGAPADLYAIGVMLFEALTGHSPFSADTTHELRRLHLYEPARRVQSLNGNVPMTIDGVVKKLLKKNPQERFQTAGEVLKALRGERVVNETTSALAQAMRQQHDAEGKKRLAEAQVHQARQDGATRNSYKEKELLEMFEDAVIEINGHSPEAQIHSLGLRGGETTYGFSNRTLQFGFFHPFPAEDREYPTITKELKEQHVFHGGYISITQDGEVVKGWNLILLRPPESLYGEWKFIEVSMSAFSGHGFRNGTAPIDAHELSRAYYHRRAIDKFNIKERPLSPADVTMALEHLIPTLIKLSTRAEEERAQRAFERDLHGDTY